MAYPAGLAVLAEVLGLNLAGFEKWRLIATSKRRAS
jgi:hypothetical protein